MGAWPEVGVAGSGRGRLWAFRRGRSGRGLNTPIVPIRNCKGGCVGGGGARMGGRGRKWAWPEAGVAGCGHSVRAEVGVASTHPLFPSGTARGGGGGGGPPRMGGVAGSGRDRKWAWPHPCPPRAANISWKGNWRCRSFSMASNQRASPGCRSSSWGGGGHTGTPYGPHRDALGSVGIHKDTSGPHRNTLRPHNST